MTMPSGRAIRGYSVLRNCAPISAALSAGLVDRSQLYSFVDGGTVANLRGRLGGGSLLSVGGGRAARPGCSTAWSRSPCRSTPIGSTPASATRAFRCGSRVCSDHGTLGPSVFNHNCALHARARLPVADRCLGARLERAIDPLRFAASSTMPQARSPSSKWTRKASLRSGSGPGRVATMPEL